MPPKIKINKDMIIKNALEIVDKNGFEALNARGLAESLNCSVQPIFRVYGSMEELKLNIYKEIEKIYNEKMVQNLNSLDGNAFLNMGMFYIHFAKEHTNYFKILFMMDNFQDISVTEIAGSTVGDDEVIQMIMQLANLERDKAQQLFSGIWLMTHGIATLCATNNCTMIDDEIKTLLSITFKGLLYILKNTEEEQDHVQ